MKRMILALARVACAVPQCAHAGHVRNRFAENRAERQEKRAERRSGRAGPVARIVGAPVDLVKALVGPLVRFGRAACSGAECR